MKSNAKTCVIGEASRALVACSAGQGVPAVCQAYGVVASGDPIADCEAVLKQLGALGQGRLAALYVEMTHGQGRPADPKELTGVLGQAFPRANVGERHGPYYLSLARTGKLDGLPKGMRPLPFSRRAARGVSGPAEPQPTVTDAVPTVTDAVPTVTDAVPTVTDAVPTVTDAVPTVTDAVPTVTDAVPTVTDAVPTVTDAVPTVTDAVPTVTDAVPTVTDAVPTVTDAVPTVTDAVPTVTDAVPTTRPELQAWLKARGLSAAGRNDELRARAEAAIAASA